MIRWAVWALLAVLLAAAPALAQRDPDPKNRWTLRWTWVDPPLRAVALSGDGRSALAVHRNDNTVLRSTDGGVSWQAPSSVLQYSLRGVALSWDGRSALAVGGDGTVLRSADGGASWQAAGSRVGVDPDGVALSGDGRIALVVGFADTVLRSTDGGASWQAASSGTQALLRGVALSRDGRSALAVGGDGTVLRSADGGASWQPAISGVQEWLLGVALSEDGRSALALVRDGTVLRSTDGGASWQTASSFTQKTLIGVALSGDGRSALAADKDGTALRSTDGGVSWRAASSGVETWPDGVALSGDGRNALAVGTGGTVLRSTDGGVSWQTASSGTRAHLSDVALSGDGQSALAVGGDGTVLRSTNGGANWQAESSGTEVELTSVALSGDGRSALALVRDGTVLRSTDGGASWQAESSGARGRLNGIALSRDGRSALAVGDDGTVLRSTDGGASWQETRSGTQLELTGVALSRDGRSALTVGDDGTVLRSADGGASWQPAISGVQEWLLGVALSEDGRSALALVRDGMVLRSTDGGASWRVASRGKELEFTRVALSGDGRSALVVGASILRGVANLDPQVQVRDANDGDQQHIELRITDQEGDPIRVTEAVALVANGTYPATVTPPSEAGQPWRISWKPESIAAGTSVRFRITLEDGSGNPLPPYMLDPFTWQPAPPLWQRLWNEHAWAVFIAVAASLLLALYLAVFGALLWRAPLRLAGVEGAPALDDVPRPDGNFAFVAALLRTALTSVILPQIKRHPRVRRAWTSAFLAGRSRIASLGKVQRTAFLESPEVLDVWVERYAVQASEALGQLELARRHRVFVPQTLRLGDSPDAEAKDPPYDGAWFRGLQRGPRWLLCIVGRGGAGKSTLAWRLGQWAIAGNSAEQLLAHRAIPVFVRGETSNLAETVRAELRGMLPGVELPDDLLRALLEKQRVLVVVDALSESGPATEAHIVDQFRGEGPVPAAMVITTRRKPELGAVAHATVQPQLLDVNTVIPFISAYLDHRTRDEPIDDMQRQSLAQAVLRMVKRPGRPARVTPLLATMCVDRALDAGVPADGYHALPALPDLFLDLVQSQDPTARILLARGERDELLESTALTLARSCLGESRVPSDFRKDAAEAALREAVPDSGDPAGMIARMIQNGLLEQRSLAGTPVLRFTLDPVAEYLAAIERLRALGRERRAWQAEFTRLRKVPGYPARIDGFLSALAACHRAYRPVMPDLPDLTFPWEQETDQPNAAA